MKDKHFIERVFEIINSNDSLEYKIGDIWILCDKYEEDKEKRNKPKHENACGSCKYFKDAIPHNKMWYTCQHSPYKKDGIGHKAGDLRSCYASMNKCCYYEKMC